MKVRVRFAPSPTGALHIGGVRTALYNYLFAKQQGGTFILRIEDTDRTRFVEGAEEYIINSLKWLGLEPDEGVGFGGEYGPYRQSDRKEMYQKYTQQLLDDGHAYYAFDTPEELDEMREKLMAEKKQAQYNSDSRKFMKNSLSLSQEEVKQRLDSGEPYVVRLKIPAEGEVSFTDLVRGKVIFQCNQLDDKVLMKGDGMPTYHMANIVDDHFMEITHVIRGEEWLPSTPLHVLLYRYLGWEDTRPQFSHLPLILKPNGKGKLSKRDGNRLGMPVFPMSWKGATEEDSFTGFKEFGFLPQATLNFLILLGWNGGTEQEIFTMKEMIEQFSIERISKSGARFDFDKAKWFNQQYIMATDNADLAAMLRPILEAKGLEADDAYLAGVCGLLKERVTFVTDFVEQGSYFFGDIDFSTLNGKTKKPIRRKWNPERRQLMEQLRTQLANVKDFSAAAIEASVKVFMETHELGFGDVLPVLRVGLSGTMKGPAVFDMIAVLGKAGTDERLAKAYDFFDTL